MHIYIFRVCVLNNDRSIRKNNIKYNVIDFIILENSFECADLIDM